MHLHIDLPKHSIIVLSASRDGQIKCVKCSLCVEYSTLESRVQIDLRQRTMSHMKYQRSKPHSFTVFDLMF